MEFEFITNNLFYIMGVTWLVTLIISNILTHKKSYTDGCVIGFDSCMDRLLVEKYLLVNKTGNLIPNKNYEVKETV